MWPESSNGIAPNPQELPECVPKNSGLSPWKLKVTGVCLKKGLV